VDGRFLLDEGVRMDLTRESSHSISVRVSGGPPVEIGVPISVGRIAHSVSRIVNRREGPEVLSSGISRDGIGPSRELPSNSIVDLCQSLRRQFI
jgi:hypothetical protein